MNEQIIREINDYKKNIVIREAKKRTEWDKEYAFHKIDDEKIEKWLNVLSTRPESETIYETKHNFGCDIFNRFIWYNSGNCEQRDLINYDSIREMCLNTYKYKEHKNLFIPYQ